MITKYIHISGADVRNFPEQIKAPVFETVFAIWWIYESKHNLKVTEKPKILRDDSFSEPNLSISMSAETIERKLFERSTEG